MNNYTTTYNITILTILEEKGKHDKATNTNKHIHTCSSHIAPMHAMFQYTPGLNCKIPVFSDPVPGKS